jgi:hypothetical protein
MGHDHHFGARLGGMLDGGHGGGDTGIGGDLAVLDGHVQVGADQHALAGEIEVGEFYEGHAKTPNIIVFKVIG